MSLQGNVGSSVAAGDVKQFAEKLRQKALEEGKLSRDAQQAVCDVLKQVTDYCDGSADSGWY
jgi:hypothetical protein